METDGNSEEKIKNTRGILVDESGTITPHYTAYLKYQREYNIKVGEQQAAYADAQASPAKLRMWPIIGKQYSDAVNDGMRKWTALGYKIEVETALNYLRSQGIDTDTMMQTNS